MSMQALLQRLGLLRRYGFVRRIATGLVIALALMPLSAPLHAADAAQQGVSELVPSLLARLRQHDTVKARFVQLKTVRILKQPLRSEGTLLFRRGRGMVWQVATPVAATYVLTAQGMREITSRNSAIPLSQISAIPLSQNSAMPLSQNSAIPNVLPLFDAIFAGDAATLAQHFDYREQGTLQQWHLSLTPRDQLLRRVFSHLELDGRDYIDTITLFDTRGDQTRIELHDPQFDSSKLGADETSLLQ